MNLEPSPSASNSHDLTMNSHLQTVQDCLKVVHAALEDVKAKEVVVLDVSGVGFDVRMPQADLASLHSGQSATVYTSMAVTQDAITLYGFLSSAEKKMFLQLQTVSGIGPKVALSLLSTLPPDRLARAVADFRRP